MALNNTCILIETYYAKLPPGENDPRSKGQCTFTRIAYFAWLAICFGVTIFRIIGFALMFRARRWLRKKLQEKERRKIHRREKRMRDKRNRKKALSNLISEKRGQMMSLQQRIMKRLRRFNDVEQGSDEEEAETGRSKI